MALQNFPIKKRLRLQEELQVDIPKDQNGGTEVGLLTSSSKRLSLANLAAQSLTSPPKRLRFQEELHQGQLKGSSVLLKEQHQDRFARLSDELSKSLLADHHKRMDKVQGPRRICTLIWMIESCIFGGIWKLDKRHHSRPLYKWDLARAMYEYKKYANWTTRIEGEEEYFQEYPARATVEEMVELEKSLFKVFSDHVKCEEDIEPLFRNVLWPLNKEQEIWDKEPTAICFDVTMIKSSIDLTLPLPDVSYDDEGSVKRAQKVQMRRDVLFLAIDVACKNNLLQHTLA